MSDNKRFYIRPEDIQPNDGPAIEKLAGDITDWIIDARDRVQNQYVDWLGLQILRQHWISQGHQNVPDPKCSCQFKGKGKPEVCAYQPKETN